MEVLYHTTQAKVGKNEQPRWTLGVEEPHQSLVCLRRFFSTLSSLAISTSCNHRLSSLNRVEFTKAKAEAKTREIQRAALPEVYYKQTPNMCGSVGSENAGKSEKVNLA